jgi:anti-anti-sigma factor
MTAVLAPQSPRSVLAVSSSRMPHPVLVMSVAGTLDAETRPAFVDYVAETLRTRRSTRALILDLTDLAHLSGMGARVIRQARRSLERHGIRVAIVAEPGSPIREAVGRRRVYDTRRAAIADQRSTRPAS